jgi:hypothetical protein
MAKREGWERGVGPYSSNEGVKFNRVQKKSYDETEKDILSRVERAQRVHPDGFASRLPKGDE